jgi:hypothetical protein
MDGTLCFSLGRNLGRTETAAPADGAGSGARVLHVNIRSVILQKYPHFGSQLIIAIRTRGILKIYSPKFTKEPLIRIAIIY